MQGTADIAAQPDNIAGIGRYFRFKQNDMEQWLTL
jgi:hypothetical protein